MEWVCGGNETHSVRRSLSLSAVAVVNAGTATVAGPSLYVNCHRHSRLHYSLPAARRSPSDRLIASLAR